MKTQRLVLAGLFAAVIAVLAPWAIPLPFVPISMQTLIIPLVASLVVWQVSLGATLVYILLGVIGLPVFAGGASGIGVLLGPTGGYLIFMPLFPLIIGLMTALKRNTTTLVASNVIAAIVQLFLGTVWLILAAHMTWSSGFSVGFTIFIIPTLLKVAIVILLTFAIAKALKLPLGKQR
ncbi:MAG: biotin transporter BioY [Lactobacillaceae bacterium]|jgi:biotin transport system substrate-specific component|nr:biotin transporter BioY [Lactobacillaceae bacterium]